MFVQLQSWYRNRKSQECRRPRTILSVEWLEERWCPAGDTYIWNPLDANNVLASNPANWIKNGDQQGANGTLPGQNGQSPDDIVLLEGNVNSNNITWDKSFTFSELDVDNGYNGTQLIGNLSTTLDITGAANATAVNADGGNPGYLNVEFEYSSDTFQIDGNSQIAVFSFSSEVPGNASGTVLIDGGATTICTGTLDKASLLNGTLKIQGLASVEDKGKTQLQLAGNNITVLVGSNALFQVDGGAGTTLVSEIAGSNNYIDVQNGGKLSYIGTGVTDTFTAPVWVEQGGLMSLSGGGNLSITGAEQGTHNVSLYLEGNFQSKNGTNLKPGKNMTATSTSSVATLDSNTVTITVASGNPCIIDGTLAVDTDKGTYGTLVVNCDTLNFDGTLEVAINGSAPGVNDQLIVNGVLDIGAGSNLDVSVNNGPLQNLSYKQSWTIITSTGGAINDFGYSDAGLLGLNDGPNCPSNGDYTVWVSATGRSTTSCMGGSMSAGATRGGMGLYVFTGSISGLSANSPPAG